MFCGREGDLWVRFGILWVSKNVFIVCGFYNRSSMNLSFASCFVVERGKMKNLKLLDLSISLAKMENSDSKYQLLFKCLLFLLKCSVCLD